MNLFLKNKPTLRAGLFILLLCSHAGYAQSDCTRAGADIGGYLDATLTSPVYWYGNVIIRSGTTVYIEEGTSIYFYGDSLKIEPGVQFFTHNSDWSVVTAATGAGSIVFMRPDPGLSPDCPPLPVVQQVLNGGYTGNPATNTLTSIEINNPLGVKLVNTDTRVGGNITFTQGHLFIDTLDAILTSAATLTGYDASKYVVTASSGHLVKENYSTAFEFPVGMAVSDYTPATITPAATNTIHVNVTSYASDTLVQIRQDGIQRTWNIFGDNAGAATIALQHNNTTNQPEFLTSGNFVTRYGTQPNATGDNASTSAWQSNTPGASTTGSVASSEVRSRAYTSLATGANVKEAYYTKASNIISPLPLQLISFTATLKDKEVVLNWKVAQQVNTDRFEVERSTDGIHWVKIETVEAAGNYSGTLDYAYTDASPNDGTNYYRLKLIDVGGRYQYSPVVRVTSNSDVTACFSSTGVYPIPFTSQLNIGLYSCKSKPATITLYTVHGKKLLEEVHTLTLGSSYYTLHNLERLPAGTYLVRVQTDTDMFVVKAMKQ